MDSCRKPQIAICKTLDKIVFNKMFTIQTANKNKMNGKWMIIKLTYRGGDEVFAFFQQRVQSCDASITVIFIIKHNPFF